MPSKVSFYFFLPAEPSRENYVQLCASEKSMIEESLNDFSKDKTYDSVSMRKK